MYIQAYIFVSTRVLKFLAYFGTFDGTTVSNLHVRACTNVDLFMLFIYVCMDKHVQYAHTPRKSI
jgi:hypothetical protein